MALEAMYSGVASGTQRDQVLLGVVARVSAKLIVMNFKIRHRAAGLAPPVVATKDLLAQAFVGHGV